MGPFGPIDYEESNLAPFEDGAVARRYVFGLPEET
jgi:hypothetical protein